jgi:hypothetical protein
MELVTSPDLPADFFVPGDDERYLIYPQKFLDETWEELRPPRRWKQPRTVSDRNGDMVSAQPPRRPPAAQKAPLAATMMALPINLIDAFDTGKAA